MAKGQQRSNREVKKPKQDKTKVKPEAVSSFKNQMDNASSKSVKPK
jgi:hypothetical protein